MDHYQYGLSNIPSEESPTRFGEHERESIGPTNEPPLLFPERVNTEPTRGETPLRWGDRRDPESGCSSTLLPAAAAASSPLAAAAAAAASSLSPASRPAPSKP